jgi:biopolymer transport protein ExbD
MGRGMRTYMEKRLPSTFKIQITSMVDMFVIILVFLLKSYSTSAVNLNPSEQLKLPSSTSFEDVRDVLKMIVSKKGVVVEDIEVLKFDAKGEVVAKDLDPNDALFIPALFEALDKKAKLTNDIAKVNDKVEFDGQILVQADKDLPYNLLQKVMYTSMLAGYANVKFAVISKDI